MSTDILPIFTSDIADQYRKIRCITFRAAHRHDIVYVYAVKPHADTTNDWEYTV